MQTGNRPEDDKVTEAEALLQHILALPQGSGRSLVAIAGAPASGKSTLAAEMTGALRKAERKARLIPMDGFHLDNAVLEARGLLARKGAPETFDADGFIVLMNRVKAGEEVVYPTFDRVRDLSIAGAAVIDANCDLVVVEGNYLLFDEPTANMDTGTEQQVLMGLKKHLSDETVLIVTHRMAPLSLVDRIIVLDSGRVAVDGPKNLVIQKLQAKQTA